MPEEPGKLPAQLQLIYDQVQHAPLEPDMDALQQMWLRHVDRAREEIDNLHIEDGGEVLYLGDLSPGCRACKEGTWDCLFITMTCNLDCDFCCSPHNIHTDFSGSAFGRTPAEIATNYAQSHINGISFSGGEPLLKPERVLEWLAFFKQHLPGGYFWLYTNGLLAEEGLLRRLGDLGLDEIRFNTAATGYDHPAVMHNIATAARYIPHVTVEVPAIPTHTEKLLNSLPIWAGCGVRYLNLHELMLEPGSNAADLPGPRQEILLPDRHRAVVHPHSRALTLTVMRHVQKLGLALAVNDCSLQSKLRQLRGRRRSLAPLLQQPHEELVEGHLYESLCAYRDTEILFFHRTAFEEMRRRYPHHRFARVARSAPLALDDQGRWVRFEKLD